MPIPTKTLLISVSLLMATPASASASEFMVPQSSTNTANIISEEDLEQLEDMLGTSISLDTSLIDVKDNDAEMYDQEIENTEILDESIDLDYELTDIASIGVIDIEDEDLNLEQKSSYPEGMHIDPYNSVAGGGVKTTF